MKINRSLSVDITNCCSTQQAHSYMNNQVATSESDANIHNLKSDA